MTDGPAIAFYWRPGCGFCARLHRALDRLGIVVRHHNIWEDADAAATVRSIARGNETVPTVVVGPVGLVNPSPAQVVEAVRVHAPDLLPDSLRIPAVSEEVDAPPAADD